MRLDAVGVVVAALAVATGALATGGCGGASADASDAGADACVGATGCNGACELGNSWGIGRFCTAGGGECADTPDRLAPFCTADFNPTDLAFCTRPCADETQCGEDASCVSEDGTGPKGCIPNFCLGDPPDAGMPVADAGAPDGA